MGSCSGLPIRPVPCVWRIIALAPGCIWAGGLTSAPVSVVPPPMGPPLGGGVGRVTAGAVVALGGGTVATSSGGGGAAGGTSLRPWLIIPLRGAVGPAISCTVVSAGTIIVGAPVAPCGSPPWGRGSAVGRFRGSLWRLGGRHGTAVLSGFGRTRRRCLRRRRRPTDHVDNGVMSRLRRLLRGPLGGGGGRRFLGAAV